MPFDQIFDAVKSGRAAAGLIIHEGQLTYAAAGFKKLLDLGEWWKEKTSLPLPLGGNVVRKDLPPEVRRDLSQIIRESIDYGLAHREAAVRHSLALCARHGRDARRQVHRHVCERLIRAITARPVGRRSGNFCAPASERGFVPAAGELEFVE